MSPPIPALEPKKRKRGRPPKVRFPQASPAPTEFIDYSGKDQAYMWDWFQWGLGKLFNCSHGLLAKDSLIPYREVFEHFWPRFPKSAARRAFERYCPFIDIPAGQQVHVAQAFFALDLLELCVLQREQNDAQETAPKTSAPSGEKRPEG